MSLHSDTEIYRLPIARDVDAVIARFDVQINGYGKVHVVTGNMHIVCGERPPNVRTRQKAVQLLRDRLDGLQAPEVHTPVVRIMVGDNNLNVKQVREALQRKDDDQELWQVFATPADRNGDNVAVCGALAGCFRPIAVGRSYDDRGMRHDDHDAVAVVITLPGASQAAEESVHGASEPAEQRKRKRDWDDLPEDAAKVARSCSPPSSPSTPSEEVDYDPDKSSHSPSTPSEEVDDDDRPRAEELHSAMRQVWKGQYDTDYDPKLLYHLSRMLFKKRKRVQLVEGDVAGGPKPGSDYDTAFASEAETGRAILSILRVRHGFLRSKNITNLRHVLTADERKELVKRVRDEYEHSEEQLLLQQRDAEKFTSKGEAKGFASKSSSKGARGASQPVGKGGKVKGKGRGSLATFVRGQKRKRWCRHLQRVGGTKQIWEVLAFSGRFDTEMLLAALHQDDGYSGAAIEPPAVSLRSWEQRAQLHHAKAEAVARYEEGARLNRYQEHLKRSGSQGQHVKPFTGYQRSVLRRWESGELRRTRNRAVLALGHGRIYSRHGDYLDIGGSTGGGSRRILDNWQPPDWREFCSDDEEE